MFSRLIGRNEVRIFKRRISEKTIHDSFFIIFIAFALILFCAVLLYYCHPLVDENQSAYNVQQCLFEVSSAFGTVGFSVGITAIMNNVGLVILCIVMFIGQIGISAAILS